MTRCFVVTGAQGAGKTTLCQLLSERTGIRSVNVGAALRASLQDIGVEVENRSTTGQTYFAHFTESDYVALLLGIVAESDVILDGLRLHSAMSHLREASSTTLIFRPSDTALGRMPDPDPYRDDSRMFEAEADFTVPWAPTRASLETVAEKVLGGL